MRTRKPEKRLTSPGFIDELCQRTGFRESDIRKVITFSLFILRRELMNKTMVRLPKIGTLYPVIKRARLVTHFKGPGDPDVKRVMAPARWQIKFQLNRRLNEELKTLEVTAAELKAAK